MARREFENLGHILDDLGSDKATARQQARDTLRTAFQRDSAVLRFDDGTGQSWLALFQALFVSYTKELKACTSKTGTLELQTTGRGSSSPRRLADVASVVRWLVERSYARLNARAVKALLIHLARAIVFKGELVAPVALDYAKTINLILSYEPHLYALKDSLWHEVAGLSFNIVLNRPLKRRLMDLGMDEDRMDIDADEDTDGMLSPCESDGSRGEGPSTSRLKRAHSSIHSPRGTVRRGMATIPRSSQPVSLEQIEFMSVIASLMGSPTAPLLSGPDTADETHQEELEERRASDPHRSPRILLSYFSTFLNMFPGDTSLHHDFLIALSSVLSHLTINCRAEVTSFAQNSWDPLVSMWGTKNQSLKEHLLVVLRLLLPILTSEPLNGEKKRIDVDALAALWTALNSSVHSRSAIRAIPLDSLQLHLLDPDEQSQEAFLARTFRHGWHFDADVALSWSFLELQADLAEQLYLQSEATYSSTTESGKRLKLENPISSLLLSIRSQASQQIRIHHLQVLLFFIDRHWHALHDEFRRDIVTTLVPFVSFEDAPLQSWTFLCLAAIARSDCTALPAGETNSAPSSELATIWDPIWTHAMRRANVPTVSRAACHAAHVLLTHSKRLLSSQRVLVEIESFVKDLDVQGPAYPYDSVCDFMVLCLRIANQDVRLYRMQMEEKVLSWLMESWRIGSGRPTTMPLHTVGHIHALMSAIVGAPKRIDLLCTLELPHSIVVAAMIEETQMKAIRDFQLHARLPPHRKSQETSSTASGASVQEGAGSVVLPFGDSADLAPPRGRERRISTFLLKSLEETLSALALHDSGHSFPTAERVRSSMDLAMTALIFEASLLMNGTHSNRRVLQAACKLLGAATPLLTDHRWKPEERKLMLGALDPLIRAGDEVSNGMQWETLVSPGPRTGIRTQVLRTLLSSTSSSKRDVSLRRELQRFVFRSADVQDAFAEVLKHIRDILSSMTGRLSEGLHQSSQISDGGTDDFEPIRAVVSTTAARDGAKDAAENCTIVDTCIAALAVIPVLQSSSGEPTRDRLLTDLLLNPHSPPEAFLLLAPPYCEQIRRGTLNISKSDLRDVFDKLDPVCTGYIHKHREESLLLVVHILDSTAHIWLREDVINSKLGHAARFYCWETVRRLKRRSERSWRVHDAIIRFLDKYLVMDPKQTVWQTPIEDEDETVAPEEEDLPSVVLPTVGDDVDIRVRFRVAATCPHLFAAGRVADRDLMTEIYSHIHRHLTTNLNDYESILSRLLCLANMVISEASVRRGAYWHLLEVAGYSSTYLAHLKSILHGVVQRIGIGSLAELFTCYASQFAYSIRQAPDLELFKFPPELLGYRDRRECAEATFHAFTPSNLLALGSSEDYQRGRELFVRHCQVIGKTEQDGVKGCFADLVSYEIVYRFNHFQNSDAEEGLIGILRQKLGYPATESSFREQLEENADGIVVGILRSLGEQDISLNGAMAFAIKSAESDSASLETFHAITKYRSLETFETHSPNLPFYSTPVVVRALSWFCRQVEQAKLHAITYHVLHQLFADIEDSPLLNEQYRLLNAICFWVAGHHADFRDSKDKSHSKDESLLRTLIRRAVTILEQVDLARGAQSLLEWCLSLYKASSKADYRLADVLIRIGTIAHDFSLSEDDANIARLGGDLLVWAEQQADKLRRNKSIKKQVIRALAAWPRELPHSLQAACEEVRLSDLTSVLGGTGISASKFRLVRRIHDLASQHDIDEDFGALEFWRFKACIPPEDYLVGSDIDAFTSLLMIHRGRVDSLGSDRFDPETVRTLHRDITIGRPGPAKCFPPQIGIDFARTCIVVSLRTMLDTCSASQVRVTYETLRNLLSIYSPDAHIGSGSAEDLRRELEHLRAFPRPCVRGPPSDLTSLLDGEAMVHLSGDYDAWIARVTTDLCLVLGDRDPFFAPLAPVLQCDRNFAEEVLPVLVHSLLQMESNESQDSTSARTILSGYFSSILTYDDAATLCHRAIISAVLHLRYFHPPHNTKDALARDKWLDMDFTLLSRCAVKCSAYTTALLFLELASECRTSEAPSHGPATEDVLFEIYSHIDEPDGFYGIQTDDLHNFLAKRLRHENQWDKAFRFHGAFVESGNATSSDTDGMIQSLYAFGFNQLALNTMQNLSADAITSTQSSALAYNLGWRAETWDLPENLSNTDSGATLYLALRAVFRERSPTAIDSVLSRAFVQEMGRLRDLGNENFTEIRQVTQNLMCLAQVRLWRSQDIQQDLQSHRMNAEAWKQFAYFPPDFEFTNVEAIMATRIGLVRSARQKEQREQIGDLISPFADALLGVEQACLLCLSEKARETQQPQIALNSIIRAQKLERNPSSKISQEFANVLWLLKEPKLAINALSSLTATVSIDKTSRDPEQCLQHASLLARLGTWSAEASMKKPSQIATEYFGPAVQLILAASQENSASSQQTHAIVFHQYAIFAEKQYHAISKSSDAMRWKLYVDRKQEEVRQRQIQMGRFASGSSEFLALQREQRKAKATLEQDKERSQEHSKQRNKFLSIAVEMYSRCLQVSDQFDEDSTIRLCSLWLANFDDGDETLQFEHSLDRVPSHKLVFLAHQLTARLAKSEGTTSRNQTILQRVILRMGRDHPFHSLFPLYCLRLEKSSSSSRRQSGRRSSPAASQQARAAAAAEIFDKLRGDPNNGVRVMNVERVCDASLEWAKYPIKALFQKSKNPPGPNIPMPQQLSIRHLNDIQVPVLTAHTPIDPTTEYRDIVTISYYEDTYNTAGGVNLPKILKCRGSDGKLYKQLYKGEGDDDLRQDAVMEQVFELVNVVLRHDRDTRRRKLSVRAYKVIPLAAQAGVLEFVENTTPLAGWLRPAHARYNPTDLPTEQYGKHFNGGSRDLWHQDPQELVKRFIELRKQFRPVMRHYFTEKHKTPMSWFSMRLHYSRSVATTSIVGHILGLGDRHTSNILMDDKTGEVVHIDLGIAFEQGKLLPQPERVPFRLTADMVDGMGISGTQGVFQRCAEETLRVLRDGSETILTVLEVFKYDPLHSWTASEYKVRRAQDLSDETAQGAGDAFRFAIGIDMASAATDEAADRALSTVARKLDKTLSVEYTVNELITEASDPANLALMYIGWAPQW